jgi:hypothetical protein
MDDTNSSYKSCFMMIIVVVLIILAILVIPMVFTSCHTQKAVTQSDTTSVTVQAAAHDSIATASRLQWMGSLNLELDSFEIILPYHFLDGTKMIMDSAVAAEDNALFQERPHRQAGAVVLKGKHASLGKADVVTRDQSRTTTHSDTVAATAQSAQQRQTDQSTTAMAKPPNMDVAITVAIIAAAIVLLVFGYWRFGKK